MYVLKERVIIKRENKGIFVKMISREKEELNFRNWVFIYPFSQIIQKIY